jgi:hypothetical protein
VFASKGALSDRWQRVGLMLAVYEATQTKANLGITLKKRRRHVDDTLRQSTSWWKQEEAEQTNAG